MTDNEGRVNSVKCKVQLLLGQLMVEAGGSKQTDCEVKVNSVKCKILAVFRAAEVGVW